MKKRISVFLSVLFVVSLLVIPANASTPLNKLIEDPNVHIEVFDQYGNQLDDEFVASLHMFNPLSKAGKQCCYNTDVRPQVLSTHTYGKYCTWSIYDIKACVNCGAVHSSKFRSSRVHDHS